MKKSFVLILAVLLSFSLLTGCVVEPAESGADTSGADTSGADISDTVSEPVVDLKPDRDGYRTALSAFCDYKTSPSVNDGGLLTDGEFETVSLKTDRFVKFNKKTEIVVDLGAKVNGIADFEIHYLVGIGLAAEPSLVSVSVSDDGKTFEEAGKIVPAFHPQRNDPLIDNAVIRLDECVSGRYIKFTVSPKSSNALMIQEVIAFSYTSVKNTVKGDDVLYTSAPESVDASLTHPTWSFETLMSMIGATDDEWDEHFDYLKNAGFEGLIILSTGGYNGSLMSPATFERCLAECKERDMRVFFGLNLVNGSDALMTDSKERADMLSALATCARTLKNSYSERYKDTFCGWYFSYEMSNALYRDKPAGSAELLNLAIDELNKIDPDMPLLMSPFTVNWGGNATELKKNLTAFFNAVDFRPQDIYCPQDSVGAALTALEDSAGYYAVMKECCDAEGIALWANVENFVIKSKVPGFESDTLAAPVSRFVKQLEAVGPYVSGCAVFTFEAYAPDKVGNYTIYTDTDDFYNNYLYYLNTGKAPNETLPEILEVTSTEPKDGYTTITVRMKTPSYRVMTVVAESGGVRRSLGRYYMTVLGGETYLSFREHVGMSDGGKSYTFRAYDFASSSSSVFLFAIGTEIEQIYGAAVNREKEAVDVADGASYTVTAASNHSNGDAGSELTDGVYGKTNDFGDAPWAGYNVNTTILIDLGEVKEEIGDILINVLDGGLGAIYQPTATNISVSVDGGLYIPVCETTSTAGAGNSLFAVRYGLESEYTIRARYIRVELAAGGWMFIDEIDVNAYTD